MKVLVLSIALLFTISFHSYGGVLKISPEKPKENELLRFEYTPDSLNTMSVKLSVFVYCFSKNQPLPEGFETEMRFDSTKKTYSGSFTLPKDIVYAMFKVGDGVKFDNNKGNYWGTYIFKDDKTVFSGAYQKSAISYMGNLPENIRRNANFIKAEEYFKKELSIDSTNIQAKIGLVSLQFDLKLINKNDFEKKLQEIVKSKYDEYSETDIRAVARALRTLNESKKADDLEMEFVKRNPSSELAEEKYLSRISQAETFEDFSKGCLEFLKIYPFSLNREKIFSAMVEGYAQVKKFKEIREILETTKDVPSSIWSQMANSIASDGRWLSNTTKEDRKPVAFSFMEKALEEAKKDYFLYKPKYLSLSEWKETRRINLGLTYQDYGKLYNYYNDYSKSIEYFKEAKQILKTYSTSELYENLLESYYYSSNNLFAFDVANETILNSKATDKIYKYHQDLFYKIYSKSADYVAYLDSLELQAKNNRLDELKKELLHLDQSIATVTTMDGLSIDLDLVRGKIILLYFWSTWCGPCEEGLYVLDYLYQNNNYKGKLAIVPVNIWERADNRSNEVKKFIKENDLKMPFYLDESDQLAKKFGLTGLPNLFIFSPDGKLQFKYVGYTSKDEFFRDIQDRIDILTKDEEYDD